MPFIPRHASTDPKLKKLRRNFRKIRRDSGAKLVHFTPVCTELILVIPGRQIIYLRPIGEIIVLWTICFQWRRLYNRCAANRHLLQQWFFDGKKFRSPRREISTKGRRWVPFSELKITPLWKRAQLTNCSTMQMHTVANMHVFTIFVHLVAVVVHKTHK